MVACLLMRKREWVVLGWAERCSHAPRAPNPRAENTGRTPGSSPCTIPSIQLHTCDVCTHRCMMCWRDVEHNFQHPPCLEFLAQENQEKAWTDLSYKGEVKDIDYQIAGVTCKSQHQSGWTGECQSLGQARGVTKNSGCHQD